VLDPGIYSFDQVREGSSFLLTIILAVAAKAFNPDLFIRLYEHAEVLYAESFRLSTKSIEIVQAMLL
jgi:hypothetical protein